MAHVALPDGAPGISGPLRQYPATAQYLLGLAQTLLRGPSSLTPGERETIAAFVSSRNRCVFCTRSHSAAAQHVLDSEGADRCVVENVIAQGPEAAATPKMRALLKIAGKVQEGGRDVTPELVTDARAAGADDQAIHDTVLTAAAFCMYNRCVEGLGTLQPQDAALYDQMGAALAKNGYLRDGKPD